MKKIASLLFLTGLLLLLPGAPAHASASPFDRAIQAIHRQGDVTLTVILKRAVPLTANLAREIYRMRLQNTPKGEQLTLWGLAGNNKDRLFQCVQPCEEGEVVWPGRGKVRMKKGDPRLSFAGKLFPANELALVSRLVQPAAVEVVPLIKLNRTEYAFELKPDEDVRLLVKQWWQLDYNPGKNLVMVRLTLDNATGLPTQLRVTQNSREKPSPLPLLKQDKWYKFPAVEK